VRPSPRNPRIKSGEGEERRTAQQAQQASQTAHESTSRRMAANRCRHFADGEYRLLNSRIVLTNATINFFP
jgi:hypothetical protein